MIYCGECGKQNPDGKKYCWKCGRPLVSTNLETTIKKTNSELLGVLGKTASSEDFNKNFYQNLGLTGDLLGEFVLENFLWYKVLGKFENQAMTRDFKNETDPILSTLGSIVDRLGRVRADRDYEGIQKQAVDFVSACLHSQKLLQEALFKDDKRKYAALEQYAGEVTRFKTQLDNLVRSYHKSRQERICSNCQTWVPVQAEICPHCGRKFEEAEQLGLEHLYTIFVKVFSEPPHRIALDISHTPVPDDKAVQMGIPIILYIDYAMAELVSETRRAVIGEMEKVKSDIERLWKGRQFSWADVAKKPMQGSSYQAELMLHYINKSNTPDNESGIDVLYDWKTPEFNLQLIAPIFLPTLLKWTLTFANMADKNFLAAAFMVAYDQRWKTGVIDKQPGPSWLNDILTGIIKTTPN